jgi:hypothetical protein
MDRRIVEHLQQESLRKLRFFTRPDWARLDFVVVSMGCVATITILTGLAYALPTDSFGLSRSFIFMRDHGGENFWALLIMTLGVLALTCTYLEYCRERLRTLHGLELPQEYWADRLLGRWVWFSVSLLWGFVGCSFLVNVPVSPGAACYVPLGIFSFIISLKARNRRG